MGGRRVGLGKGAGMEAVIGLRDVLFSLVLIFVGKNRTLGGTHPQTPAEGRLRPPDLLQKGRRHSI